MILSEKPDNYYDLVQRIGDMFGEMDSDMMVDLADTNAEYAAMRIEARRLHQEFPLLEHVLEGSGAVSLTAEEHEALSRYSDLARQMEDVERQHIYFRGHTDAFAYFKRIGVI